MIHISRLKSKGWFQLTFSSLCPGNNGELFNAAGGRTDNMANVRNGMKKAGKEKRNIKIRHTLKDEGIILKTEIEMQKRANEKALENSNKDPEKKFVK